MGFNNGRVTTFLANGGGAITFRVALSVLGGVTLWLLQSFGSHIVGQLDDLAKAQTRMAALLAAQAEQLRDSTALSSRNADRLDDHEHRITILEARAPNSP
ncbi:MAG TPA: hypothetical protein VG798_00345 [Rhizomicrobium sp.]|nr:hypothetical protein [Rhizomicrobium sp.]